MVESPEWVHGVGKDVAPVLRIVHRRVDGYGCLSVGLILCLDTDS